MNHMEYFDCEMDIRQGIIKPTWIIISCILDPLWSRLYRIGLLMSNFFSTGNTGGRALLAFMPYNKNPKTPFSIVSGGLRQIAAYIALFPRYDKPTYLDYNTLQPLSTTFKVI